VLEDNGGSFTDVDTSHPFAFDFDKLLPRERFG
jgi:hypothetical protein